MTIAEQGLGIIVPNEIGSSLFEQHPGANYWIGKVVVAGEVVDHEMFDAVRALRAEVYGRLGYISPDAINEHGLEINEDDERSTVFVVAEKVAEETIAIRATARSIHRGGQPLPLEYYFPEAAEVPLPENTDEISRIIAVPTKENKRWGSVLSGSLMRAIAHDSADRGAYANVAQVEEWLMRDLINRGLSVSQLSDPKFIEEENGMLYAIKMDQYEALKLGTEESSVHSDLARMFSYDRENKGLGYFTSKLLIGGEQ